MGELPCAHSASDALEHGPSSLLQVSRNLATQFLGTARNLLGLFFSKGADKKARTLTV